MYQNSAIISSDINRSGVSHPPSLYYGTPMPGPWTDYNYPPNFLRAAAESPAGGSSIQLDPHCLNTMVEKLRWENSALQRKLEQAAHQKSSLDLKLKTTEKELQQWKEQTSKLVGELQALKNSTCDKRLVAREMNTLKVFAENWAHQLRRVCNFHPRVPTNPNELIQTKYMDTLIGNVRELLASEDEKQLWKPFVDRIEKPDAVPAAVPAAMPSASFQAPQEDEHQFEVVGTSVGTGVQLQRKKLPSKQRGQNNSCRTPTKTPQKVKEKKTTKSKFFKCQVCPSSFEALARLRVHMASDHDVHSYMEGMLGCKKCGDIFPTSKSFHHHLASKHGIPLDRRTLKKAPPTGIYNAEAETVNDQPYFLLECQ